MSSFEGTNYERYGNEPKDSWIYSMESKVLLSYSGIWVIGVELFDSANCTSRIAVHLTLACRLKNLIW